MTRLGVAMRETLQAVPACRLTEEHLHAGTVRRGCEELRRRLGEAPQDQVARYGLGVLEFLAAFERLSQRCYAFGSADGLVRALAPWLALVPANPQPEPVTYHELRALAEEFLADLRRADDAFAGVQDARVRLPLRLGLGRLDLDGDGVPERPLTEWLRALLPEASRGLDPELLVSFDRGDAAWFRGYCKLFMGLLELGLAYDHRELFETAGYLLFPRAVPTGPRPAGDVQFGRFLDAAALLHLVRFPLEDGARLAAALEHFEAAIASDLECWEHAVAQTDDDHEWLPNPRQKGVLGVAVSGEMIDAWRGLLSTAREVLAGRLLIPYWRGGGGINVRRAFLRPRPFDLVLWIQGLGALPYVEQGPTVSREVARRLTGVFGSRTLAFGLWFN